MPGRQVVVDGSNIATEGRSLPSLRQLDEAVRAFIEERTEDDHIVVVVDATFEHRIDRSERKAYREALDAGELLTPPAGTIGRGDKFILEIADKSGAVVLSNDSFQEFQDEYEWLFDAGRLVGGKPVPGVGWIFTPRSPVRATRKRGAASKRSKAKAKVGDTIEPAAAGASGAGEDGAGSGKRRGRRGGRSKGAKAEQGGAQDERAMTATAGRGAPGADGAPAARGAGRSRRGGDRGAGPPAVNEPLPFIEFVAEHPIGATVQGQVTAFSSHGAHAVVDGVQCYVPLKLMGDPAPNRARDVLEKGETRSFVVVAFDSERRGVDLGLPGVPGVPEPVPSDGPTVSEEPDVAERSVAKKAAATKAAAKKAGSVKKTGARKAAAGKASAKKAAATKAGATNAGATKKAAVKKAATTKATATKATATKKVSAKKAAAKKAAAKKAGTPAKKAAVKKAATARKAAATKKASAKKAAAKKAGTPAKKAAVKKAATARKGAATKAAAKRTVAKKAAATKGAATKATATKKASATKAAATTASAAKPPARRR